LSQAQAEPPERQLLRQARHSTKFGQCPEWSAKRTRSVRVGMSGLYWNMTLIAKANQPHYTCFYGLCCFQYLLLSLNKSLNERPNNACEVVEMQSMFICVGLGHIAATTLAGFRLA
jgi:hypothetical protein